MGGKEIGHSRHISLSLRNIHEMDALVQYRNVPYAHDVLAHRLRGV